MSDGDGSDAGGDDERPPDEDPDVDDPDEPADGGSGSPDDEEPAGPDADDSTPSDDDGPAGSSDDDGGDGPDADDADGGESGRASDDDGASGEGGDDGDDTDEPDQGSDEADADAEDDDKQSDDGESGDDGDDVAGDEDEEAAEESDDEESGGEESDDEESGGEESDDEESDDGSSGGAPMYGGGGRTAPPQSSRGGRTRSRPSSESSGDGDDADDEDEDGDEDDDGDGSGSTSGRSGTVSSYEPETAPDDEEMPLTDHVEEMAYRVLAVGLVMVVIGGFTLFYADQMINFLWYSFLGPGDVCPAAFVPPEACPRQFRPRVYHPLSLIFARLKVATLVGTVGALPVAVYQTYRFMRPGLYPRERRYYLAAVPTSLVLAAAGVTLAYYAILPALFSFFSEYSKDAAELAFGLQETFNLIVIMLGFFALIFQIPLLIMLAIMMGVTTRRWLERRRLYFWAGFGALAFVFSPDPTGMAPLLVAVTMIALFDGTLLLLKWTSRGSLLPTVEGTTARRPHAWLVAAIAGYLASPAPAPASYFGSLPGPVRSALLDANLAGATPILVALGLIGLFEVAAHLVRGSDRLRLRLAFMRARLPVWITAVVFGYLAAPDPALVEYLQAVETTWVNAGLVVVGLAVLYEVGIGVLKLRERRS